MKHPKRMLVFALILILLGGFVAWMTQTSGGSVTIKDARWVGSNGTMMSGLLYIPDGVTAENPAPGIVAIHGYINSRETQDGFSIEFARRGYVVLASDQTGHGYSDGPAFANGFGGPDALAVGWSWPSTSDASTDVSRNRGGSKQPAKSKITQSAHSRTK